MGAWLQLPSSSDKKPIPRYEHGMARVGDKLYVVGGSYGGWRVVCV